MIDGASGVLLLIDLYRPRSRLSLQKKAEHRSNSELFSLEEKKAAAWSIGVGEAAEKTNTLALSTLSVNVFLMWFLLREIRDTEFDSSTN
jgi:hypothetical protein